MAHYANTHDQRRQHYSLNTNQRNNISAIKKITCYTCKNTIIHIDKNIDVFIYAHLNTLHPNIIYKNNSKVYENDRIRMLVVEFHNVEIKPSITLSFYPVNITYQEWKTIRISDLAIRTLWESCWLLLALLNSRK